MPALALAIYFEARYTIYANAACKWCRPRRSWLEEKQQYEWPRWVHQANARQ